MRQQWISELFRHYKQIFLGLGIALFLWAVQTPYTLLHPMQSGDLLSITPVKAADSHSLIQQGRDFYQAGQWEQAIAIWQQAEQHFSAQADRFNQALTLSYLSLAYQQLGRWAEADQAITASLNWIKALPEKDASASSASTRSLLLAQVLNTQGHLQFTQGQTQSALNIWQQATILYAREGDIQRQIGSLINQAQAQQTLGFFLQAQQTLTNIERLLQNQSNLALKATALRSLGNLQFLIGNTNESIRILKQSLAIAEQQNLIDIGATLLSLGNVIRTTQESATALDLYQRIAASNTSNLVRTQAILNQFSLLLELGKTAEANALIADIQTQLKTLPISRSRVYAQIHLAQSLLKHKQHSSQSAQILPDAIQQARELSDRRAESYALGYLGQAYSQTQQWQEAQRLTEQALLIAQGLNASDLAYQWQWQLGRILQATQQSNKALQAYAAAFTTLKAIRNDLAAVNPDVQFSFREQVEPVYREYVSLLLQQSTTADDSALKQARQVIESLQVAELNNFFRTNCLEGQLLQLDRVDQTGAAVLYPIILSDRLEVILSLPGQALRRYSFPVSQQTVETTLNRWRQNLEKTITTPEGKQLGQQVYNWLIRPIEAELTQQSVKTLVFVLDGDLRSVPMAAIFDGQQYLIERYSIALSPGLQLLAPQPLRQRQLAVLAAGLTQERHGFSALENVKSELQEIQSTINSKVLLNEGFTSATLQEQVNTLSVPIVHLATHGQFSSEAENTFLLAWDKPISVTELGTLLKRREETREDAIELLVLSACETATGDKRAALGLAGVAVQAGARSTLASLWSLDDLSGAQFSSEFYRNLTQPHLSKAEAVRQAQLTLLKDPTFRHPRFWAPYVLIGNWL